MALSAAGVTWLALPVSLFQASAIVAIDEPSAALRLAAARSAADLAVSKPVMSRAASSLNGTVMQAPVPTLAERFGVVTGFVGATSAVTRLAESLVPTVTATAGDGLVEIRARSTDASRASRIATALAEALVVEEDGSVGAAARRREASTRTLLDALRETARTAHAKLAGLGLSDLDPALGLDSAHAAILAAEARLAAIHAVIAAGTPPLGAGRELPPSAATLQQTYWDLRKQLDKASETLGERHTTVIALRDGVARAATSLTAEWQRIERGAADDLGVARAHEVALRKTALMSDPAKRAVAGEARAAARIADAAVARAATLSTPAAADNPPFRLMAPAGVPAVASGLGLVQRSSIVVFAGMGAFVLAWLASGRRRHLWRSALTKGAVLDTAPDVERAPAGSQAAGPALTASTMPAPEPMERPSRAERLAVAPETRIPLAASVDPSPRIELSASPPADAQPQSDNDDVVYDWAGFEPIDLADDRMAAMPFQTHSFDVESRRRVAKHRLASPRSFDPALRDALRAIAAELPAMAPAQCTITVMVAANAAAADTGAVALALGEAAAELGYRVLVIEGGLSHRTLAEAVALDGDPFLVDAFGALRVALPAEHGDGLFLAPAFREGARIAAALARNTRAELVDDLGAVFDAIVIDGGRAADSAAEGWSADAFIRVGRFASRKDDTLFLDAFGAASETLLGTVAAGRFVAHRSPIEPRIAAHQAPSQPTAPHHAAPVRLRAVPGSLDGMPRSATAIQPSPLRVPPRRRIVAR